MFSGGVCQTPSPIVFWVGEVNPFLFFDCSLSVCFVEKGFYARGLLSCLPQAPGAAGPGVGGFPVHLYLPAVHHPIIYISRVLYLVGVYMAKKGKGSGWHGESVRHKLAASGISMRANAVFRPYGPTGLIDYRNNREWIFAFWKASIEDDWEYFDFKKAAEQSLREIDRYLFLGRNNNWERRKMYNAIIEQYGSDVEVNLARLGLKLIRIEFKPKYEQIAILDEMIDFQHHSGGVLRGNEDYIEVVGLREEFDRTYGRPMG